MMHGAVQWSASVLADAGTPRETACSGDSIAGTVLNICLALIALAALSVALWQLRLQRDAAGGRGVLLHTGRIGLQTVINDNVVIDHYRLEVEVAGPGTWHELALDLEKNGREFNAPNRPEKRSWMSCESTPMVWDLDLRPDDGDNVWCVVTWVEPSGPALRTNAFAIPVRGGVTYQWKWFPGLRQIGLLSDFASEHGPGWFRRHVGRPRPRGRWRRYREAPLRDGNGPLGLGKSPDGRRPN
jgi:hypothetical protein